MGKKDAPDAPDYRGAAEETSQAQQELMTGQTWANRPNQYTPWGSNTWESTAGVDPATGLPVTTWDQTIELSPAQQQALEAQQNMQAGRSELALGLMGQAGQDMQTPEGFWNNLPEVASTPTAPDFYGQNLPTMGQWPNPQGQPPPAGTPEYGDLAPWGQTPQNGGIGGALGQGAPLEYAGPSQDPSQGGMMGGMPPRGDVAQSDMSGIGPAGQGPQTAMGDLSQYGGANINTIMGNLGNVGRGVSSQMGDLGQVGQGLTMGSYTPEDIQRSLDFSGLEDIQSGGTYQDRFAQAQFERDMSLQGPLMQRAQQEQESALRNQGLRPGTPAYDNALRDLRNQQGEQTGRMSADALARGGAEQQNQFMRELQARQQGVSEIGQQGQFYNQAAQQAIEQQFGIGDRLHQESLNRAQQQEAQRAARAAERQQQFGMDLEGGMYDEAQRQARMGERMSQFEMDMGAGQFGESQRAQRAAEMGQQFGQDLAGGQFSEAQRAQRAAEQAQGFGQDMQSGQMTDAQRQQAFAEQQQGFNQEQQAGSQQFGQDLQSAQQANALRQQQFNEMQQLQQNAGGSADAEFQRQLQAAQFANQQRQQAANEQLAFGNQGYQQQMQSAAYQQALRQQAIAEQQQREGWALNQMNAAMSGQQVATPQMPSFSNAGVAQAPNYLGAANMAGQYGMQQYNANQANSPFQMLGNLGAAAAGGGMFGAGGMFGG